MEKNISVGEKDIKSASKKIGIKSKVRKTLKFENSDMEKTLSNLKELKALSLEIENNIRDLKEKIEIEEKKVMVYKLKKELKEGDDCFLCGEIYKGKEELKEINVDNIKTLRKRLDIEIQKYEDIQYKIIFEV